MRIEPFHSKANASSVQSMLIEVSRRYVVKVVLRLEASGLDGSLSPLNYPNTETTNLDTFSNGIIYS